MKQLRTKLTAALAVLALVLSLTPAALAVGGITAKAGNIDLTLNGTTTSPTTTMSSSVTWPSCSRAPAKRSP